MLCATVRIDRRRLQASREQGDGDQQVSEDEPAGEDRHSGAVDDLRRRPDHDRFGVFAVTSPVPGQDFRYVLGVGLEVD